MRSESNFTAVVKPHRQFVKRQPFFSIIIPTYSRREQLSACLQSLTRLDYPRDRFEVIVVDDGSETPPIAPVALFQDRLNLTLLTQPHAGPATARNTGAAQAKGDFLVFTDDDCAPAPDWLQTLAARFASAPDHAIGGQTLNALHDNLYSTASQALINYLYAYYNAVPGKAVFFTSNNLALPAGRFRAIGGFDTRFLLAAGEDRELCDRWLNHGYPMTFAPEVVVYHAHALTLRSFGRQHFNYGRSAFHFHRVRARRREAGIKVEPLSFYLNMLRRSLVRGWRGLWPAVLLAVSQLANAAGFFYERFRSTNQQAEKASYSKQPAVITEKVFKWWDYPLFILLTGLSSASILYFMWYWFSFKDWLYYPVTFSILTFILIVKLSINQFRWFLLPCMRRPRPVAARSGWKVGVATTYVPGAEPLAMLAETVRALVALDYPHDTWVLDEGDDEQVKALCLRLGADYFSRGNLPHYQNETGLFQSHSKHGNYNAWLSEIGFDRYEIITAFDPDHVPDPTFLSNVLGYFEDPKIGYVQVAQVYYNQKASFIARGAAEETYAYYSATQMASYAMGYPIITGSHNTHRASALKQVGGFAPHDADDLLITLFYRVSGWQGVYVPQILARGLTPVDWSGYLTQQTRWARSILDIKFRIYPKLARNLPFRERVMSLLHGLSYLQGGVTIFVGVILIAFMLATGITPGVVTYLTALNLIALYVILQLCDFYRQRFYLDPRSERGLHWRAGLLQLAKWPYLLLVIRDVILGRRLPYALTRKTKAKSRNYLLLWPHMLVVTVICTAWVIGLVTGRVGHPLLHVLAAITVLCSLVPILTELLNFPDPYDEALFSSLGKGNHGFASASNGRFLALEKEEEKI